MTYEPTQKEKADCWDAYCAEPETLIEYDRINTAWTKKQIARRSGMMFLSDHLYRIHKLPEPEYRAYTAEELLPLVGQEVLIDGERFFFYELFVSKERTLLEFRTSASVRVYDHRTLRPQQAADQVTYLDGTPFGKAVE